MAEHPGRRILLVTHQYLPEHVGGTEVYSHGVARRLLRRGHDVRVLTYREAAGGDPADHGLESYDHEGVPVTVCAYNLSLASHPATAEFDNPEIPRLVGPALDEAAPDLVHVLHPMKLSGSILAEVRRRGWPLVLTLVDFWFLCLRHTLLHVDGQVCPGPTEVSCLRCARTTHGFADHPMLDAPGWVWRSLAWLGLRAGRSAEPPWPDVRALARRTDRLRELALGADRLVALSDFQRDVFVDHGYPRERIEVLPHGLDLEALEGDADALPRSPGPPVLGIIGSLVPHKGVHVVLAALREASDLELELRIYGDHDAPDEYVRELVREAQADPRVTLCGRFPPARFGGVLRDLDLLLVPVTWYENAPLVVKAALHLGVPLLASRIGSIPGMIPPERHARSLVPVGAPSAWVRALRRRLSGGPPPRPEPVPMKSLDENVTELVDLYEQLLARRSPPCASAT